MPAVHGAGDNRLADFEARREICYVFIGQDPGFEAADLDQIPAFLGLSVRGERGEQGVGQDLATRVAVPRRDRSPGQVVNKAAAPGMPQPSPRRPGR